MNSPAFQKALRKELKNPKSTGSVLLDRVFKIPYAGSLLLVGEAAVGTTAVAIQLIEQLSLDHTIIYLDTFNSGSLHRLADVNLDNLIIWKCGGVPASEILTAILQLQKVCLSLVVVVENICFLEKTWEGGWTFYELVKRIRSNDTRTTIIGTNRYPINNGYWDTVVSIQHIQNIYNETDEGLSQLAGHLASVESDSQKQMVYIDHYSGRVSKAFEKVRLEVDAGKSKTSVFELDGVRVQGAWKFIHAVGKQKRNELRIDEL